MSPTEQDKYSLILQSAIEIISEKGLYNTSISDIVRKAGVAQGTFYLYFRSKNALIPAIAENLILITMDRIKKNTKHLGQFAEFLKTFIQEVYNITEEYRKVIVLVYSGLAIEDSMDAWEAIYLPYYEWFESVLLRGIEAGEILSQTNVHWTSKLIVNIVENAAERYFIARDQDITKDQSKEEVFQFVLRAMAKKDKLT